MWIKIISLILIWLMQSNNESLILWIFDKRIFLIYFELIKQCVTFFYSGNSFHINGNVLFYGSIFSFLLITSIIFYMVKILYRSYFKMKSFNDSYEEKAKKYIEFQDSINQDVFSRLLECKQEQIALKNLFDTRASLICCICQNAKATQTLIPCGHFCLCGKCLRKLENKSNKNVDINKCPQCRAPIQKAIRTFAS